MKHVLFFASFLSLITVFAPRLHAQEGTERLAPFAHGAGRTYALTARGLDAVEINPALLSLGTPRTFELTIAPFTSLGFNSGSSFSTLSDLPDRFKNDSIVGDTNIINSLYNNQTSADLALRVFGLSYYKESLGTFALTWDVHAAMRSQIPDTLLRYLTPPYEANFISSRPLTPQHVDIQGIWYNQYGLSYARNLLTGAAPGELDLSGGVTLSYIRGVAYMRVEPNSFVSFNQQADPNGKTTIETQYRIQFASPDEFNGSLPTDFSFGLLSGSSAGSGFGASLGFIASEHPTAPSSAQPNGQSSRWKFALSVADIGSINWSSHTDIRKQDSTIVYVNHRGNDFTDDSLRSYLDQMSGKLDTTDAAFSSLLPTTLHIAGSIDMSVLGISMDNVNLTLASEFALGLTDVVGSPNKGRFGIAGILDYPSAVGLRTALGMTVQDGAAHMTFALGTSLWNRFTLDLGSANIIGLFGGSGPADFALGMKIMF